MNPEPNNHNEENSSDSAARSVPVLLDRRKDFKNSGQLSFRDRHSQRWVSAKILQIDHKRKTWNGGSCESVYQLEVEVQDHVHQDDRGHDDDDRHHLKELNVVELPYYGSAVETAPMYSVDHLTKAVDPV